MDKYKLESRGIFVLLISFACTATVLGLIMDFSLKNLQTDLSSDMLFNLLSYLIIMIIPVFCFEYFVLNPKNTRLKFDFSSENFYTYLLIFPMMFGMMLVSDFFVGLVPTEGRFLGGLYRQYEMQFAFLMTDKFAAIIMTVIFAPLLEEILFRGIVLKGLLNRNITPWKAIVISSLCFGIFHFNPWQFTGAVLLGCVLGLVYYKTKSLLLPVLLHAFNNLCSAVLSFYGHTESFAEIFKVSEWIVLSAGILLFGIFYFLFMKYKVHYSE